MVPLQQAVVDSQKFLFEVFPQEASQDLTLEGVELTDDTSFWLVTFSYRPFAGLRKYKTVKLRSSDGMPFGIKNADLATV
jgi:hypothetical protein